MTDTPTLERLGQMVADKRGKVGVRATAHEIGLSPATLSRVERGQMPDLANFTRICKWLELDPAQVLGFDAEAVGRPMASVHFRSRSTVSVETGRALGELIVEAGNLLAADEEDGDGDDDGED